MTPVLIAMAVQWPFLLWLVYCGKVEWGHYQNAARDGAWYDELRDDGQPL